jgi:hypothetical protein
VAHIVLGRCQPFERALGLGLIPGDADHHASGTRVLGHDHRSDAGQPDARIGQLAFEDGFDLFADGFAQPAAMIFPPTLLQSSPRMEKTCKDIRKEGWERLPRSRYRFSLEFGRVTSEKVHKRVANFSSGVVGDSHGSALHILHQTVEIIARVRDADHANRCLIPEQTRLKFRNRDVKRRRGAGP